MSDSWVIVTGGGRGIGKACVEQFSKKYQVASIDLRFEQCDPHSRILQIESDVSQESTWISLFGRIARDKLAGIVHSAAIQPSNSVFEMEYEEWVKTFQVNVDPVFHSVRFLPQQHHSFGMVLLGSVHAKATSKGMTCYAGTKGAISSLTRSLSIELGPRGIRVNAVIPGAVDTPMLQESMNRFEDPKSAYDRLGSSAPLAGIASPEDIAEAVEFAMTSPSLTGQEIVVDRGVSAKLASE